MTSWLCGILLASVCLAVAPALAEAAESPGKRWSEEQARAWYEKRPWPVGFNYVPSSSVNTTEIWQAATFPEKTIARELAWAKGLGFNTCRIFVQYLVWKEDPEGLKARMDRFLAIADHNDISTVFVLFDDCAFGDPPRTEPYLGPQAEPIPGMILPCWTPSPGLSAVADRSAWPDLERYVKDVVGRFRDDRRVLMWDLYNEPGNSGMGDKSLPLVEAAFAWARAARPSQPLTVATWNDSLAGLNAKQIELSDVVTFHAYTDRAGMEAAIRKHRAFGRPVLCTEWMARLLGGRWETDLPLLKAERVGCYNWGLVNGRTQANFPWWSKRGEAAPKVWFHDLLHWDGAPYDPHEIEVIRRLTGAANQPAASS